MVKPIPEGYHSVTPYLIVDDANAALEFYVKGLGAQELMRMSDPDGRIGHAEMKIGNSFVMLADANPGMGFKSPKAYGGSPISLMLYVENVDNIVKQAIAAGAKIERPVEDQFYGDRRGTILDPFGHSWTIATHIEDVSFEEMERRLAELIKKS